MCVYSHLRRLAHRALLLLMLAYQLPEHSREMTRYVGDIGAEPGTVVRGSQLVQGNERGGKPGKDINRVVRRQ